MKLTYPSTSPYASTKQTSWYLGKYVHRSIPSAPDDKKIIISAKYENRPDLLANDLYGSPAYWWVFMVRNRNEIKHPLWDLVAGMQIMVPSQAHLNKSLGI